MFNITCLDQNNIPIRNFSQWDMGQSILIDGLTLDKPPQVHYWNAQSAQAYVDDKVTLVDGRYKSTVPNTLLMSALPMYVAVFVFDSATTSGKTIAQVRLSVNARPEPADYVFENNVDIVYIKDLVKEIDGVKNTVDTELIPKMDAFRTEVSKATTDVRNVSTTEQSKITAKSTEEQNKITALATTHKQEMQEIKNSIPADYSVLSNNVTTILDTFADGVKNTVSGAVITLDDSSAKKCNIEILGKTEQLTTKGINICNEAFENGRLNSTTGLPEDMENTSRTANYIKVEDDSDYYIYLNTDINGSSNSYIGAYFYASDKSFLGRKLLDGGSLKGIIHTPIGCDCIKISTSYALEFVKGFMVCKSTVEQPYEPYTGGESSPSPDYPQEIKGVGESGNLKIVECSKNLFFNIKSHTINGITLTNNEDGSYTLNGTTTNGAVFSCVYIDKPLPAGTYYFQANNNKAIGDKYENSVQFRLQTVEGSIKGVLCTTVNAKSVINMPKHSKFCDIRIASGVTLKDFVIKPQVEMLKYTDFEIGKIPLEIDIPLTTPLYGLDKPDRICKKDGLYGVERCTDKFVVNDKTDIVIHSINDRGIVNFSVNLPHHSLQRDARKSLCSHFIYDNALIADSVNGGFYVTPINVFFRIHQSRYSTVGEFKQFLATSPITTIYTLEEPTFEPFSEDIQQKLNALTTYYGTTNLYTTDDLQPTINVDYVADTKLYINKQIKNAVADLQSQLANTLSLMPLETQATMIENDTNNLLQSI